ncbi:MAG TPA: GNAT family N-acetyltransferase [Saprospirales bacterium]|nr:GNAT family N-acetyltransferase [Saprospirales bacterium]
MKSYIRNAEQKDYVAISALSEQLGYKTPHVAVLKRLKEILKNPEHCVLVAVDHDQIIGWVHGIYSLRIESEIFVEITGLIVDQDHRNKGTGKKLVEHVQNWAKLQNCKLLRARTNTLRAESHPFYEKLNFTLNKEQKVYDKIWH